MKSKLVISFVPAHRYRKYFTKGYNQSELLAKNLAKKLGVHCSQLVEKKKHTKSQAKLDRKARLTNLQKAFVLKENIHLNGMETVLLIDDVTTTGSTLNQMAKVIKKDYPKVKVRGLVIARHNG
ncbi:MAG: phosphoribosyltransferase family protein [candidate division SR1 bacterium]|nr:phosphoribosyltransferase family protein [candidate division SR1 bacterium]